MKTGDRYGAWTVLEPYPHPGIPYALCRCDCGFEREVARPNLISGASSRCQKCQGRLMHERSLKNLTGHQFGCWFVVDDPDWVTGAVKRRVIVQCIECKENHTLAASTLRGSIERRRCGTCYRRELAATSIAPAHVMAATGISRQGIHQRIRLRNWTVEDAQTQPRLAPHGRRRRTRRAA